jgi:hypothetical protein
LPQLFQLATIDPDIHSASTAMAERQEAACQG